jgi:hypothetical protein
MVVPFHCWPHQHSPSALRIQVPVPQQRSSSFMEFPEYPCEKNAVCHCCGMGRLDSAGIKPASMAAGLLPGQQGTHANVVLSYGCLGSARDASRCIAR